MSSNKNPTQGGRHQQQPSSNTQGSMGPPPRPSGGSSSSPNTQQQNSTNGTRQLGMPYEVGTSYFLPGGEQNVQPEAQTPQPQGVSSVGQANTGGGAAFTGALNGGRLEGPYPVGSQYAGFRPAPPSQAESESGENLPLQDRQPYPMESAYDGRFPRYDTLSAQHVNEARGSRYPMPEANIRPTQPQPGRDSGGSSNAQAARPQQASAPAIASRTPSSTQDPRAPPPKDGSSQ